MPARICSLGVWVSDIARPSVSAAARESVIAGEAVDDALDDADDDDEAVDDVPNGAGEGRRLRDGEREREAVQGKEDASHVRVRRAQPGRGRACKDGGR